MKRQLRLSLCVCPVAAQDRSEKHGEVPMVRLHVKHGEGDGEKEFLYDCQGSMRIEGILREILQIANLQLKIDCLSLEFEPSLAALYGDKKGDTCERSNLSVFKQRCIPNS